jgi:hypothetical protein
MLLTRSLWRWVLAQDLHVDRPTIHFQQALFLLLLGLLLLLLWVLVSYSLLSFIQVVCCLPMSAR